ncbi:MAG: hypothetical protein LBN93_02155, partial [Candidatus Symbiothrix sp.]|nr:hypothetical protein [Candidatus Symbiothrix sp.]
MKKLLFIAALALVGLSICSNDAQAQFTKKLGKAVENSAKRTTERKATQKTDEAVSKGIDKATDPDTYKQEKDGTKQAAPERATKSSATTESSGGGDSKVKPQTVSKPSAAAIAADPGASDNTIDEGFTRSRAEIRAAYEQLSDAYFIPYYYPGFTENNFYFLNEGLGDASGRNIPLETVIIELRDMGSFIDSYMSRNGRWGYYYYEKIKTPDTRDEYGKEGYVISGQSFLNAQIAMFAADPEGYVPYNMFVYGRFLFNTFNGYCVFVKQNRDSWDGVSLNDGKKLVINWHDWNSGMRSEISRLNKVLNGQTPFAVLLKSAERWRTAIKEGEAKGDKNGLRGSRLAYHRFEIIMDDIEGHPKKVENDAYFSLKRDYKKYEELYEEWYEKTKTPEPKQAMPKAGMTNATLESQMLSAAKAQWGDWNPVKVVIRDSQWTIDKTAVGGILRRRLTCFLICK